MTLPAHVMTGLPAVPENQDAEYERWFLAQVQAAIDDPSPDLAHEQVMDEVLAAIAEVCERKARAVSA